MTIRRKEFRRPKQIMDYIENLKGISKDNLSSFITSMLGKLPDVKSVLVIFPDYTRIDFTDRIAPLIIKRFCSKKMERIDFLNAGGTHRAMNDSEFISKLGVNGKDPKVGFYNHDFSSPKSLKTIGNISEELVIDKTYGQLKTSIPITVNKMIFDHYDLIIAISGTVPHEAAGYSGGLKVFFPGVSGQEIINLFHWAAVLVGIPGIIGTVDNNARDIINAGSRVIFDKIESDICSFIMVNIEKRNKVVPLGLYIDSGFEGFLATYKAASLASSKIHVKYIEGSLTQALQVIPDCYDEVWTAGKGSYKLQKPGVMAQGGEIILYAPHIVRFHSNSDLEKDLFSLGYHCRDNICTLLESGMSACKNAAAHVINVAGSGTFDPLTKEEKLSFKVTLATGIPKEICESVGLGYRDPATIKRSDFTGLGKLWIEEGGKYLYDLKKIERTKSL